MASTILNGCCGVKLAVTLALGLGSTAVAAPPRPSPAPAGAQSLETRLLEAFQRRDVVELERAARRLGIGGMRAALRSARAVRAAALAAAPLVPKSWLLLPDLVPLCGERDRSVALAAAEAAHRIADDLRRPELQMNDDLPDSLAPQARQLARLAGDQRLSVDVRVRCAETLAQLLELVAFPEDALLPLLDDVEPAVRRTATELFVRSRSDAARARLARMVVTEGEGSVARAAAAVLCADVPLARRQPAPGLAALKKAGALPRLRELCSDSEASPDELLELARCLIHEGTPADRQALRGLQARSPSLRRQLQRLTD